MKLYNVLVVGLAALTCFSDAQQSRRGGRSQGRQQAAQPAQQAQPSRQQQGLTALIQTNRDNRPRRLVIKGAGGKDTVVYFDRSTEQDVSLNVSRVKLFFIQTPEDLAAAERALTSGDLAAARTQLAAVKDKYKGYVGLDRNPSTRAAMLEIECAVRQLDFAGLNQLVNSFSHPEWLSTTEVATYMAAKILAKAMNGAALADIEAEVKKLLDSEPGKTLNSSCYGWLQFAIAHAMASAVPAEEIAGTISEGNLAAANNAINAYCRAGLSSHGRDMELPVQAMIRAQAMLWAMPGVKEYAARGAGMDAAKWNGAPANFRDAVALAYMIKNVFGGTSETVEAAAKLYFNSQAGRGGE